MKLLEENVGVNFCDIGLGDSFLDTAPTAKATKEKIDKLNFVKIFKFCASKYTISSEKTTLSMGEKFCK